MKTGELKYVYGNAVFTIYLYEGVNLSIHGEFVTLLKSDMPSSNSYTKTTFNLQEYLDTNPNQVHFTIKQPCRQDFVVETRDF